MLGIPSFGSDTDRAELAFLLSALNIPFIERELGHSGTRLIDAYYEMIVIWLVQEEQCLLLLFMD